MINKLLDLPHKILFPMYFLFYSFFLQNIVDSYMNYYYLKYFDSVVYMFISELVVLMIIYIVFTLCATIIAHTLKFIYSALFKRSSVSTTIIKEVKR